MGRYASSSSVPFHSWPHVHLSSSAYLLASSAMSPLYGKLSDLIGAFDLLHVPSRSGLTSNIGRKPILFASIAVFLVSIVGHNACIDPGSFRLFSSVPHCVAQLKT